MNSKTAVVCTKQRSEWDCSEEIIYDRAKGIQNLNKEKAKIAEIAKHGAIAILQDALKKKDTVLMKQPKRVAFVTREREHVWVKRHAILTEDLVKKLIEKLYQVRFKEDTSRPKYYAYVYPMDETKTVYLCDLFWKASKYLGEDSQPGTLIHEVAHFLGKKDLTYEKSPLFVACQGSVVRGNPATERDTWKSDLQKAEWNADNISQEFDLTLCHKRNYVNGIYLCCGERERYSVCEQSVPRHFSTCDLDEIWKIKRIRRDPHDSTEMCDYSTESKVVSPADHPVNRPHEETPSSSCRLL